MRLQSIFIIAISILLISCGTKKWGEPIGIELRYDQNSKINYGHSFKVHTYLKYSEGKEKDITGKSGLEYSAQGGNVNGSRIGIDGYPTYFRNDTVYVSATYIKKELNFTTKKIIPFNYKGDLELRFEGGQGESGENGSDGSTPLLFRDGKNGYPGLAGDNGTDGHDLTAHIYKDDATQVYYIKITDLNTSSMYYLKNKDAGFPIKFYVGGGKGGSGGTGGEGGNGKDGKKTEKKTKRPGDGGDGGDGGIGGNGGNGGSIYVFIHPSAKDIQSRIIGFSLAGAQGDGGKGGKGGKPGTPLDGQDAKSEGLSGGYGSPGQMGVTGAGIQFSIEDFDIDF